MDLILAMLKTMAIIFGWIAIIGIISTIFVYGVTFIVKKIKSM